MGLSSVLPPNDRAVDQQDSSSALSKNKDNLLLLNQNPQAEEILLQISSREVGNLDVIAYASDEKIFIPLFSLFNFLKIKCEYADDLSAVKGFFISQDMTYYLDLTGNTTTVGDSTYNIPRDNFYITESEVYVNSILFEKLFGLKLTIDLHSLQANLFSERKLPAVIEYEREMIRRNIQKFTNDIRAEKDIPLDKNWVSGFLMDWNIDFIKTPVSSLYSYSNNFGAEIAGGDFQGSFTGDNYKILSGTNSNWRWRYVYDNSALFKQGLLGDVYSRTGFNVNVKGAELTNSPVNSRKLYGDYRISDQTFPHWKVELYLNNILVKYVVTDSSGYYNFTIPMPYGMNFITLKLYGPNGEEQVIEKVMQTPFTLIPRGEFEYSLIGGKLKYYNQQKIYELNLKWGAASNLTFGTGVQYLSSRNSKYIPNLNVLYKPAANIFLSLDYVYHTSSTGTINVVFPSLITGELSVTKFGTESFISQAKEERKLSFFLPLKLKNLSTSLRFNITQNIIDSYRSIYNNFGLSVLYSGFQFEMLSNLNLFKTNDRYKQSFANTSIIIGHRILFNYLLRQRTDVDHSTGKIIRIACNLDGNILNKGWLSFSIYKNMLANNFGIQIGFTYELPFAHSISNYFNDNTWAFQQGVYGDISYDQNGNKFLFDNQSWVGNGGVTLVPFIDKNNNDIIDGDEKELDTEYKPVIETGRLKKDSENVCRFVQLEAYNSYLLNIDPYSFSDPVFRPKYKSFSVKISPNQYKLLAIPVYASCDITGNITLKKGNNEAAISNLKILLESTDGKIKKETITFSDGSYSFEGLVPGSYKVSLKKSDLKGISSVYPGESITLNLEPSEDGTFIDGINFTLIKEVDK